jgi:hypothetical protein
VPLEPDLPDDVLLELGRLTWASVNLEDRTYGLCSILLGDFDSETPIGTRIRQARAALASCPATEATMTADAWLTEAMAALEGRNAILHATPVTWVSLPGTEPIPDTEPNWLTYIPRKRAARSIVHTALTAPALRPVRQRVEQAIDGWVEVAEMWWDEHPTA